MKIVKKNIVGVVVLLFVFILVGCHQSNPKEERFEQAKQEGGDIQIGLIYSKKSDMDVQKGVNLGVDEINQAGGINGRKIKIIERYDDEDSIDEGMLIANDFVKKKNIHAVIAYLASHVAVATAATYEAAGILMLNVSATSMQLTSPYYSYVFRIVPNNGQNGRYLAQYAAKNGYKRVLIYYVYNEYGRDLANAFEKEARHLDITVVDRQSYIPGLVSYQYILDRWKMLFQFDAFFLAARMPEGALIVKEARNTQVDVDIFAGASLHKRSFIQLAGSAGEGVAVLSFFNQARKNAKTVHFIKAYEKRYGHKPGHVAAMGYDAIHLIAYAMKQAGSVSANHTSQVLRTMQPWEGVIGHIQFDQKGDLVDPSNVLVEVLQNGQFVAEK